MIRYAFHPAALADLDQIRAYIARDNPDAADRFVDLIVDAAANLVDAPYQGHLRSDLTSRPLRFVRVRAFLIAYAPDESPLWIVAALHGRRDPRVLTAILRSRKASM